MYPLTAAHITPLTPSASSLENVCEVFSMVLVHKATYIPKSPGCFKLPQGRRDMASLLLALSPLQAAKSTASKMIRAIKKR
ncbi:hypothetical protein BGZ72_009162 [Mortierella alpina]|nr:hypothetical protein BGZ72_009162 [Mortierella alpina]